MSQFTLLRKIGPYDVECRATSVDVEGPHDEFDSFGQPCPYYSVTIRGCDGCVMSEFERPTRYLAVLFGTALAKARKVELVIDTDDE